MIWFTSDTHFGDSRLIDYNIRDFKDINEMDNMIIKKWNEVVNFEDTVYHLGDFTLNTDKNYIKDFVSKLNGKISLVKGNHDTESLQFYYECGFAAVYDFPIIIKDFIILSHKPLSFMLGSEWLSLYGHVHISSLYKTWEKQRICVCTERHDYYPVSFSEIFHKYV